MIDAPARGGLRGPGPPRSPRQISGLEPLPFRERRNGKNGKGKDFLSLAAPHTEKPEKEAPKLTPT